LIEVAEVKLRRLELTGEGEQVLADGTHEYNVFKLVGEKGVPREVIEVSSGFWGGMDEGSNPKTS
jgi:hypothetical protein